MLGLDIRDAMVVSVLVDESGQVMARAEQSVADTSDPTAAARMALDALAPKSDGATTLGIASAVPDSAAVAAVLRSLGPRFDNPSMKDGVIAAGTAAAIAESWIGAAKGVRDVAYFAVGEHTTAGIVREGVAVTGAHRRAPAVAWLSLNPVEREDYRKTGCLEAEVAAPGIVRRLVWRIKAGDRSRIQDVVQDDLGAITVDHVIDAAREGDGVSISVMRDTAKYLGMAAANLVVITDPEMLVLGGIMSSSSPVLIDAMRMELGRRLPPAMMETLKIATASLGSDAVAIGAARMAAAAVQ